MASDTYNTLNLGQLMPEFDTILNGFPNTGAELSAWFVAVLLGLTVLFLLISLRQVFLARQRIEWINDLLKGHTSESIARNRQELIEKAQETKHEAGHLWLEFDETLIEDQHLGRVNLYNTYDAAYFFNNSTLAAGITESRLLAAVPGFLTALGVIGTFVGLQLGLSELNIAGDVSIEEMKGGIAGVINGAKFAFMTSVWGVALSVLFNFIEKWIERIARSKVSELQNRIDKLFPHITAENQLQRIADDSKQSRESLQGLAEKIGEKMQESLLQVSTNIQTGLEESLEKIMAPAINKLVDETSDGNQKALESLVEKFMDRFGEQGTQQRVVMNQTSEKVNAALDGLNTSMSDFISRLEASQNASGEREIELVNTISRQVSQLVEQGDEQKRMLTGFINEQLGNMTTEYNRREEAAQQREQALVEKISTQVDALVSNAKEQNQAMAEFVDSKLGAVSQTFATHQQSAAERETESNRIFVEQTTAMKAGTEKLMERVERGLQTQMNASSQLLEQGRALQTSIETSVRASAEASSSMKATATELNSAASSMNLFGSHIREAGNQLSGAVTSAVESTNDLAQQNQLSSEKMEQLRGQLRQDTARLHDVIEKMNDIVEIADNTFDNMTSHQNAYLSGLNKNVKELADHMTRLLNDYAERANSQTERHLNVWAEGTTQYTTQMNSLAKSLSSVVDEIQGKTGR